MQITNARYYEAKCQSQTSLQVKNANKFIHTSKLVWILNSKFICILIVWVLNVFILSSWFGYIEYHLVVWIR
jgi:hypothetical protein